MDIDLLKSIFKAYCRNGDVKLDADRTPWIFWRGEWEPICGHWFWDNQEGARLFCQKLGYEDGTVERKNDVYSRDSFMIGKCNAGDVWGNCLGGCNEYQKGNVCSGRGERCTSSEPVKISISCNGWNGKIRTSCGGNSL